MQTMASVSVFSSVQDVGYGALWVLAVAVLALKVALWHIETLLEDRVALVVCILLVLQVVCVWWLCQSGSGRSMQDTVVRLINGYAALDIGAWALWLACLVALVVVALTVAGWLLCLVVLAFRVAVARAARDRR
jgi:hypothetical protein